MIGIKPEKKPINNLDNRFKPTVDPRILRSALKQKDAYLGEGKLNMEIIEGTNARK